MLVKAYLCSFNKLEMHAFVLIRKDIQNAMLTISIGLLWICDFCTLQYSDELKNVHKVKSKDTNLI